MWFFQIYRMEMIKMNNQTADYISLKPLADRFREAAGSIDDDEIKDIIRFKIEEKIEEQLNRIEIPLSEIIEEWFDDDNNVLWVMSSLKDSIENKLYDKKKRW